MVFFRRVERQGQPLLSVALPISVFHSRCWQLSCDWCRVPQLLALDIKWNMFPWRKSLGHNCVVLPLTWTVFLRKPPAATTVAMLASLAPAPPGLSGSCWFCSNSKEVDLDLKCGASEYTIAREAMSRSTLYSSRSEGSVDFSLVINLQPIRYLMLSVLCEQSLIPQLGNIHHRSLYDYYSV